jgi:hypothetical protein
MLVISIETTALASWSGVLLEKLIVDQLLKKLPSFYGTQKSIAMFTGPYPELDESTPHPHSVFPKDSF